MPHVILTFFFVASSLFSGMFNAALLADGNLEIMIHTADDSPLNEFASVAISQSELVKATELVVYQDQAWNKGFQVQGFIMAVNAQGSLVKKTSASNLLTQEQLKLLAQLKAGEVVSFENIRVLGPDKTIHEMDAISIKVGE